MSEMYYFEPNLLFKYKKSHEITLLDNNEHSNKIIFYLFLFKTSK